MEVKSTIKSLYFIGPSSTGKSTLFCAVVEDMGLDPGQCVTEVARTVVKNTDFSKYTIGYVNSALHPFEIGLDIGQGHRDATDNSDDPLGTRTGSQKCG